MIRPADDSLFEISNGVGLLTPNRPDHGNSIRAEATPSLVRFFREAQLDSGVRCLVIRGARKHFCTGGDVQAFARALKQSREDVQRDFNERLQRAAELVEAVASFDRPIIASCRGVVAGAGLLFALAADWTLADETVQFMFSHTRVGLCVDGGVSYFLPRIVGPRVAKQLAMTGAVVAATEAQKLGLATSIFAAGELETQVEKLSTKLARSPQAAVSITKRLIDDHANLRRRLDAEREGIVACVGSDDFVEGVRAFTEKRQARFPSAADA